TGMADCTYRHNLANWRRLIKAFGHGPWAPLLFRLGLQIAARHIKANGIAIDMVERIALRDIRAVFADGNDQFDFVMEICRLGRIGDGRVVDDDGIGWLFKKER